MYINGGSKCNMLNKMSAKLLFHYEGFMIAEIYFVESINHHVMDQMGRFIHKNSFMKNDENSGLFHNYMSHLFHQILHV